MTVCKSAPLPFCTPIYHFAYEYYDGRPPANTFFNRGVLASSSTAALLEPATVAAPILLHVLALGILVETYHILRQELLKLCIPPPYLFYYEIFLFQPAASLPTPYTTLATYRQILWIVAKDGRISLWLAVSAEPWKRICR